MSSSFFIVCEKFGPSCKKNYTTLFQLFYFNHHFNNITTFLLQVSNLSISISLTETFAIVSSSKCFTTTPIKSRFLSHIFITFISILTKIYFNLHQDLFQSLQHTQLNPNTSNLNPIVIDPIQSNQLAEY